MPPIGRFQMSFFRKGLTSVSVCFVVLHPSIKFFLNFSRVLELWVLKFVGIGFWY